VVAETEQASTFQVRLVCAHIRDVSQACTRTPAAKAALEKSKKAAAKAIRAEAKSARTQCALDYAAIDREAEQEYAHLVRSRIRIPRK
jgi:hypothetical protein